jgi:hypothetical protein
MMSNFPVTIVQNRTSGRVTRAAATDACAPGAQLIRTRKLS